MILYKIRNRNNPRSEKHQEHLTRRAKEQGGSFVV